MWLLWLYIIYGRLKWTKWILKSSFIPCLERVLRDILEMYHLLIPFDMPVLQFYLCAVDIESWLVLVCTVLRGSLLLQLILTTACFPLKRPTSSHPCTYADTRLCVVSFICDSGAWGLNVNVKNLVPREIWGNIYAHLVFSRWWAMIWLDLQILFEIRVVNFCRLLILHLDKPCLL